MKPLNFPHSHEGSNKHWSKNNSSSTTGVRRGNVFILPLNTKRYFALVPAVPWFLAHHNENATVLQWQEDGQQDCAIVFSNQTWQGGEKRVNFEGGLTNITSNMHLQKTSQSRLIQKFQAHQKYQHLMGVLLFSKVCNLNILGHWGM